MTEAPSPLRHVRVRAASFSSSARASAPSSSRRRPDLHGHEIEISPSGGGPRTHSLVRERHTAVRTVYAAVYPVLPRGDYVVWREDGMPAGQVTIRGGQASRFRWPEVTPASTAG